MRWKCDVHVSMEDNGASSTDGDSGTTSPDGKMHGRILMEEY